VDKYNTRAINLYKKAGFEIEGTIQRSYKLSQSNEYYDEYLMGLLL
jgi:RimJ/RimL family protein N-acetyltransferase